MTTHRHAKLLNNKCVALVVESIGHDSRRIPRVMAALLVIPRARFK